MADPMVSFFFVFCRSTFWDTFDSSHMCANEGRYQLSMTAEGTLGYADLRPYNTSIDFIGQAIHTTYAPYYYNDVRIIASSRLELPE